MRQYYDTIGQKGQTQCVLTFWKVIMNIPIILPHFKANKCADAWEKIWYPDLPGLSRVYPGFILFKNPDWNPGKPGLIRVNPGTRLLPVSVNKTLHVMLPKSSRKYREMNSKHVVMILKAFKSITRKFPINILYIQCFVTVPGFLHISQVPANHVLTSIYFLILWIW